MFSQLLSNAVGQRRRWLVIDPQNLLSNGVSPASKKTGLGRSPPTFDSRNAGNIDTQPAKMSDQCFPRGVVAYRSHRMNARAKGSKIVSGVGAASRNESRFAVFEDQDRRFA